MSVVLNGLTALKPRTGIGQYTARLAAELNCLVYPPEPYAGWAKARLNKPGGPPGTSSNWKSRLKDVMKHGGRRVLGWHFRQFCRANKVSLYHEPNYIPFEVDVPTVVTVHDLSVLLHPEWHPADRVREHVKKLELSVARAAAIITDTEQVKREVIRELGVSDAKVTAVPLGVGEEFIPTPPLAKYPQRYFLCVGTIEPRKNLLTAMKAYASLPKDVRDETPLLLAGPWGWRADAEFEYFSKHGQVAGIRHLGYVPDSELPALYANAQALLYPSLYEGFGLPPLEAVACGGRVICSTETLAVREVMGNAATYCEALDVDGWRAAMLMDGVRNVDYAKRFTWKTTAALTTNVYQRFLSPLPSREGLGEVPKPQTYGMALSIANRHDGFPGPDPPPTSP